MMHLYHRPWISPLSHYVLLLKAKQPPQHPGVKNCKSIWSHLWLTVIFCTQKDLICAILVSYNQTLGVFLMNRYISQHCKLTGYFNTNMKKCYFHLELPCISVLQCWLDWTVFVCPCNFKLQHGGHGIMLVFQVVPYIVITFRWISDESVWHVVEGPDTHSVFVFILTTTAVIN
jgi:hypothetical protein